MKNVISVLTILMAAAFAREAKADDPFATCRPFISRESFESLGGKLVMTRQPEIGSFPKNIAEICRGAAGLGILVLKDGSVITDDFEHNWFSADGDTEEMTGQRIAKCDAMIEARVKKMRFNPPRLNGKPVCLNFSVNWTSSKANELSPFGVFPR